MSGYNFFVSVPVSERLVSSTSSWYVVMYRYVYIYMWVFMSLCVVLLHMQLLFLLQQSFGFITCCERNESIFFHFSQYSGDAGELRPGG